MNWDALGAIAELLGAIAVFLTLAYLTIQVRTKFSRLRFAKSVLCGANHASQDRYCNELLWNNRIERRTIAGG